MTRSMLAWRLPVLLAVALAALAAGAALADSTLRPAMLASGGGTSSSQNQRLQHAAGQAAPIGVSTSGNARLEAGFFYGASCVEGSSASDPDGDGDETGSENAIGTDPCRKDTDGDACVDGEETQPNENTGGDRDPLSQWDFFDVPQPAGPSVGVDGKPILQPNAVRSKTVTLGDVGVVLAYVGRSSSNPAYIADNNGDGRSDGQQLDRTPSSFAGQEWRSGPPNNAINLQDVGVALAQVGDSCLSAP